MQDTNALAAFDFAVRHGAEFEQAEEFQKWYDLQDSEDKEYMNSHGFDSAFHVFMVPIEPEKPYYVHTVRV